MAPSAEHIERMFFHGISEQLKLIQESQQRTEVLLALTASTLTDAARRNRRAAASPAPKSDSVSRVAPASASVTN